MIPIALAKEPDSFKDKVRKPGQAFLANAPAVISRSDWNRHSYWRHSHSQLYRAYGGLCAYCASITPRRVKPGGPDSTSVDHFIPKSVDRRLAYEWSNYRLCRARLNQRKGDHQDVVDPFTLAPRSFHLDFITFLLKPDPNLATSNQSRIRATINRLELNIDKDYVEQRIEVIKNYCLGRASKAMIQSNYPFIAIEMQAQDFDTVYFTRMKAFFATSP